MRYKYFFVQIFIRFYAKIALNRLSKYALNPQLEQEKVLRKLLKIYSKTQFGIDHQLKADISYEDMISLVPIKKYSDLSPYLDKAKAGKKNQIVKSKVLVWEKTSGSSGTAKNVPYNFSILRTFQKMLLLWASDLLLHGPKLKTGKMFFSISPPFVDESENKIVKKHSLNDDSEYLPWIVRKIIGESFINPKGLKSIQNPESFKLYLCSHLIGNHDLEVLFVWSPSYLIELAEFMQKNRFKLIEILKSGKFEYNGALYNVPRRADLDYDDMWINFTHMWKELKLISCWIDGSASIFIEKLKSYFPSIMIQGKGLLATEGPMSYPLIGKKGSLPLFQDIFYEFIDSSQKVFRLNELKLGEVYEIIFSHSSGFFRYAIGDQVKVTNYFHNIPCFKFVGRKGNFSDMTGEKLCETRVQEILLTTLGQKECACLLPVIHKNKKPHYVCLYDGKNIEFEKTLELKLMETFHYMQSRKLGQLDAISTYKVNSVEQIYFNYFQSKGMLMGDIKFTTLINNPNTAAEILDRI